MKVKLNVFLILLLLFSNNLYATSAPEAEKTTKKNVHTSVAGGLAGAAGGIAGAAGDAEISEELLKTFGQGPKRLLSKKQLEDVSEFYLSPANLNQLGKEEEAIGYERIKQEVEFPNSKDILNYRGGNSMGALLVNGKEDAIAQNTDMVMCNSKIGEAYTVDQLLIPATPEKQDICEYSIWKHEGGFFEHQSYGANTPGPSGNYCYEYHKVSLSGQQFGIRKVGSYVVAISDPLAVPVQYRKEACVPLEKKWCKNWLIMADKIEYYFPTARITLSKEPLYTRYIDKTLLAPVVGMYTASIKSEMASHKDSIQTLKKLYENSNLLHKVDGIGTNLLDGIGTTPSAGYIGAAAGPGHELAELGQVDRGYARIFPILGLNERVLTEATGPEETPVLPHVPALGQPLIYATDFDSIFNMLSMGGITGILQNGFGNLPGMGGLLPGGLGDLGNIGNIIQQSGIQSIQSITNQMINGAGAINNITGVLNKSTNTISPHSATDILTTPFFSSSTKKDIAYFVNPGLSYQGKLLRKKHEDHLKDPWRAAREDTKWGGGSKIYKTFAKTFDEFNDMGPTHPSKPFYALIANDYRQNITTYGVGDVSNLMSLTPKANSDYILQTLIRGHNMFLEEMKVVVDEQIGDATMDINYPSEMIITTPGQFFSKTINVREEALKNQRQSFKTKWDLFHCPVIPFLEGGGSLLLGVPELFNENFNKDIEFLMEKGMGALPGTPGIAVREGQQGVTCFKYEDMLRNNLDFLLTNTIKQENRNLRTVANKGEISFTVYTLFSGTVGLPGQGLPFWTTGKGFTPATNAHGKYIPVGTGSFASPSIKPEQFRLF